MIYNIYPLGDSALTIEFGKKIDETINKHVLARFYALQKNPLSAMIEAVPAYASLTIFYDIHKIYRMSIPLRGSAYEWMKTQTENWLKLNIPIGEETKTLLTIPVCYDDEYAPDLEYICKTKKLSKEELVSIHTGKTYRVYMLGFLPGFAYMGELDDAISFPRKQKPHITAAGSVGIAGKQTGIYPLQSQGGWQIIGRTPLKMFDATNESPTLLKAGDEVRFKSISKHEFNHYPGGHS